MDVSVLDAIDVHTHVHRSVAAPGSETGAALEAMAAYFKTEAVGPIRRCGRIRTPRSHSHLAGR